MGKITLGSSWPLLDTLQTIADQYIYIIIGIQFLAISSNILIGGSSTAQNHALLVFKYHPQQVGVSGRSIYSRNPSTPMAPSVRCASRSLRSWRRTQRCDTSPNVSKTGCRVRAAPVEMSNFSNPIRSINDQWEVNGI